MRWLATWAPNVPAITPQLLWFTAFQFSTLADSNASCRVLYYSSNIACRSSNRPMDGKIIKILGHGWARSCNNVRINIDWIGGAPPKSVSAFCSLQHNFPKQITLSQSARSDLASSKYPLWCIFITWPISRLKHDFPCNASAGAPNYKPQIKIQLKQIDNSTEWLNFDFVHFFFVSIFLAHTTMPFHRIDLKYLWPMQIDDFVSCRSKWSVCSEC